MPTCQPLARCPSRRCRRTEAETYRVVDRLRRPLRTRPLVFGCDGCGSVFTVRTPKPSTRKQR